MTYNRQNAVNYAHQWAYNRNPRYFDFSNLGGDCTNFISQCLHAGNAPMNYTKTFGWYYSSSYNRAPAWTGVQFFYNFLMNNKGVGPKATESSIEDMELGDVIQLSFDGFTFGHSLLVVDTGVIPSFDTILIATHTDDADYRPLSSYTAAEDYRCLKIFV